MTTRSSRDLDPIGVLSDPVRRQLYEYVVASGGPVDRETAATGVGIGRPLAAFHLDRLAEAGLLDVEFRRRSGRSGPGAGRPAKFYLRPAAREVAVSFPPRQYDLAAEILAAGIERRRDATEAVVAAARERGARLAEESIDDSVDAVPSGPDRVIALLAANGYEPFREPDGTIRLRNCPFHALVAGHRELTCSMNLAMLQAATETVAAVGLEPVADPREGLCCVAFVPRG